MRNARAFWLSLAVALAGCRGKDSVGPGPDPGDDTASTDDSVEEVPGHSAAEPWTRDEERSPGSVTFTELYYADPSDPQLEWIELYNPMSFDMDLSGWSLTDGVDFTFPEGSRLGAGAYLVVAADPSLLPVSALGPYSGSLADGGERVTLRSNGGRRMDSLRYGDDEPWPVQADGSGLSLAKLRATDASDRAENWTFSAQLGGTPGAPNAVDPEAPPTLVELFPLESTWRYEDSGAYPSADWAQPSYNDGAWSEGDAAFYAGAPNTAVQATVRVTADNYYGLYIGEEDGSNLTLIAEDPDGSWTSVESVDVEFGPLDHLYLAAWEAPGDNGGPQMLIAEIETDAGIVGTSASTFEWVEGPVNGCPGTSPPDPPPGEATLAALVSSAAWSTPGVETARTSDPWAWAVSTAFDDATRYIWADTFDSVSLTNNDNTYALFRTVDPIAGARGQTEIAGPPTTTLFRTEFTLDADPARVRLFASCELDDGAVFYLNGVESLRVNMPEGGVDTSTRATATIDEVEALSLELGTGGLVRGQNTLAVELHQARRSDPDLRFDCALSARIEATTSAPSVVLNEVGAEGDPSIELLNLGAVDFDTTGLILRSSAGEERVLSGGSLAPGALLAAEGVSAEEGEVLFLYSAGGGALLDAVRVQERVRGREAGGPWRYPSAESFGEPNLIERTDDVVIHEILYHAAPVNTESGYAEQPLEWIELYNRGDQTVDLSGWQLVDAVAWVFPEGTLLEPDAYLVVANDAETLRQEAPEAEVLGDFEGSLSDRGDRILLLDANKNPADEVRYFDGGSWPEAADGGGASLELRDPFADNNVGAAWAASDESARTAWQTVTIEGTAEPSAVGPDGTWNELVLGLLDAGEVLIDDLSVVQSPNGGSAEVLRNGSFDDLRQWRILGNHRHSELATDPDDPSNSVLRLVATGPTEHMHNHAETTLTRTLDTREYRVSFRARWVSGSNQLNTRLYFNRLPHTTLLDRPTQAGTPGAANSRAAENIGPTLTNLRQDVAVPQPGEPVEIRVRAADPDGVAALTLWYAVDGGAAVSVAMQPSGEDWVASFDGQAAGAVVQFYVEAVDSLGESTSLPAAGPDSRALVQFDDGQAATNGLHNLRLIMTEADSDWLLDEPNLMSNDLVGATVVYDDEVFYDVGVRAKGSERGRPTTPRLGYGVHFNPEQLFRGSHTSALIDRSEGVNYGQREVLINLVMARAGIVSAEYNDLIQVITPRSEHTGAAELQLDRSTNLVLDAQFEGGADGDLYDYELIYYPYTTDDGSATGQKLPQPDGVVGTSLTDLGGDKEDYRWNFMLQNNLGRDRYTGLIQLCQTFSTRGSAAFPDEVGALVDMDLWMRAFAIASLAGAVDNYGGDGAQHNARFYQRPSDGLFIYFPHDLDYFSSATRSVVGNGDLNYLIQDPVLRRSYYQHLDDLLSRAYNRAYLDPWCTQIGELLPSQDFDGNCQFIEDRASWVERDLNTQFPAISFAITTNSGQDFTTADSAVTLEGEGWVDVRWIAVNGVALEPTWQDERTWQLTIPLAEGQNDLELVALNLASQTVASDAIGVTYEP